MLTFAAGPRAVSATSQSNGQLRIINAGERVSFTIPAQRLADALSAFSAATGIEVLVAGDLLANRRSTEIQGELNAEAALQALLAGTGLVSRFLDSGAFTLTLIEPRSVAPQPVEASSDLPRYARYSAMVQSAVKRALCQRSETRPGYYRVALQLWISASGGIDRSVLTGTSGDPGRDAELLHLFGNLAIGEPPPAGLPQPATLLILPRSPRQTADCAAVDRAGGP